MGLLIAWLATGLALIYAIFLSLLRKGWQQLIPANPSPATPPFLSILIPARNEAMVIKATLEALIHQDYPANRYELIVIDDHSADATPDIVTAIADERVHLLRLAEHLESGQKLIAYKKAALELGVRHARGDYIITTDADCVASTGWLSAYAAAFQAGNDMVLAPVVLQTNDSFLHAFQALDVAATMMVTGASVAWGHPLLANGANMGFRKAFFYELNAYAGNEQQASGDDIFLLQKAAARTDSRITFLPQTAAFVTTYPTPSWRTFFRQRLRWAAKTGAYKDFHLIAFQAAVFALDLLLLLLIPAALLWSGWWLWGLLLSWAIKSVADYRLLLFASNIFGGKQWMKHWPLAQLLHPVYIVVVGALAMLPLKVSWKGRSTRR